MIFTIRLMPGTISDLRTVRFTAITALTASTARTAGIGTVTAGAIPGIWTDGTECTIRGSTPTGGVLGTVTTVISVPDGTVTEALTATTA